MKTRKTKPSFEPNVFLAKVDVGRTISEHQDGQIVFSQGEPADSVFYIQKGKVKITVVSEQGKEAVVAILGRGGWRKQPSFAYSMKSQPFPRCSCHIF